MLHHVVISRQLAFFSSSIGIVILAQFIITPILDVLLISAIFLISGWKYMMVTIGIVASINIPTLANMIFDSSALLSSIFSVGYRLCTSLASLISNQNNSCYARASIQNSLFANPQFDIFMMSTLVFLSTISIVAVTNHFLKKILRQRIPSAFTD